MWAVGTKREIPEQGLTNAEDLTTLLPGVTTSARDKTELTNLTNSIIYGPWRRDKIEQWTKGTEMIVWRLLLKLLERWVKYLVLYGIPIYCFT